jgi:hypothetical protein
MSGFYELIGRIVVGLVRWRYGEQIRNAALVGAGLAVLGAVAYVATSRDADEEA